MVKKSIRISDEASIKLDEICLKEDLSQTQVFEKLVNNYYAECINDSNAPGEENVPDKKIVATEISSDKVSDILNVIKYVANENNKKLYILTDLMNSLISTALKCDPYGFRSANDKPHDWFDMSSDRLQNILNEKMAKKKQRGEK